jgi:hypothetical protein
MKTSRERMQAMRQRKKEGGLVEVRFYCRVSDLKKARELIKKVTYENV